MNALRISAALATIAMLVACAGGGGSIPSAPSQDGRTAFVAKNRTIALPKVASSNKGTRKAQDSTGALVDGGFESGGYTNWQQCGSVNARVATYRPHTGSYSDLNGQVSKPEINGDSGLCQEVTVPANGHLTFWLYEGTSETSTTYSFQEADLLDSTGATITNIFSEANNGQAWVQRNYDLSTYAGQDVWIYFGVHADGYASGNIYQYVDDVAWAGGSTPTPAPTATPTAGPTPTPTAKPTATPTAGPTPTPVPTATPTPHPTATPTPTPHPTATPTVAPTPTPGGGPTPFPTPAGSGPHGTSCGISCGVQRWHIKTLDDGDEHLINWVPKSATVTQLASIPVPSPYDQYNDTTRYAPTETQAYTVRAVIVGWKTESDNDFHIVISDPNNPSSTMIVEPPDSACSMACDSGFGPVFDAVRTKLTNCFGQPTGSFVNFTKTVVADFTGVPLFDALHGQTGVAPNGIELHPLLQVNFVSGGC